ncbi:MAG: hypothetical protein ACKVQQ_24175 [Burkholderiales bacterium]
MKIALSSAIVALLMFFINPAFGQAVQVPAKMIGATLVYEVINLHLSVSHPDRRKEVEYVLGTPPSIEKEFAVDIAYAYIDATKTFQAHFFGVRWGSSSTPDHWQVSQRSESGSFVRVVRYRTDQTSIISGRIAGEWHDEMKVVDGIVVERRVYNSPTYTYDLQHRLLRIKSIDAKSDAAVTSAGR